MPAVECKTSKASGSWRRTDSCSINTTKLRFQRGGDERGCGKSDEIFGDSGSLFSGGDSCELGEGIVLAGIQRAAARRESYRERRDAFRRRLPGRGGVADRGWKSCCGPAREQAPATKDWGGGRRGDACRPRLSRRRRVDADNFRNVSLVGPAFVLTSLPFTGGSQCGRFISAALISQNTRLLSHPFLRLFRAWCFLALLAASLVERGKDGACYHEQDERQ